MATTNWDKVLFRKQSYPDNYVDPEYFLKELKKNLHTRTYSIKELINLSQIVLQPFSWVCLFLCFYFYLSEEWANSLILFFINLFCFVVLALLSTQDTLCHFLQPSLFLHAFLTGVAPILSTLTQSISEDTLWAMTVSMFFCHLCFYSYTAKHSAAKHSSLYNAISLNAVIFAAVCLASTLHTSWDGFTLVSTAIHIFLFSPQFDKHSLSGNVLLIVCTLLLLMSISLTASIVYFVMATAITIGIPMWLISLQHLKNNIYGPWDEAVMSD